ncbi:MAG: ThuA domain-containing protein [Isosphaeraceae bacterium]
MSVRTLAFGALTCMALVYSLAGAAAATAYQDPSGTLRVLIITGQGDHDWRATSPFLRQILEASGRCDVRVCEVPTDLTGHSLDGFDVVVDDVGGVSSGGQTEKAIDAFVRSGKGLVLTYGALNSSPGPRSFGRTHLAVGFLDVKATRPDHPIVAGLPRSVRMADSYFVGVKPEPETEVPATSAGEPVLMASRLGKGRVLYNGLGHSLEVWDRPDIQDTWLEMVPWALGLIPGDATPRLAPGK